MIFLKVFYQSKLEKITYMIRLVKLVFFKYFSLLYTRDRYFVEFVLLMIILLDTKLYVGAFVTRSR